MKIESLQNKKIKERCKLHLKKERDQTSLFLIEDEHLIEEAIQAKCLYELYVLEGENVSFDFPYIECSQPVLNKLSQQVSDSKMIGVCHKPVFEKNKDQKVLLCDDIQDPGNMGTLIRTAYSFGFDCIYVSRKNVDIYNSKTIQSSQGSFFHIPVIVCDLKEKIKELQRKQVKIYATALYGQTISLQDVNVDNSFGIVVGNEGNGIKEEIIECCDTCIKIEMEAFESLNVAIAAAIVMYTFQYAKKD